MAEDIVTGRCGIDRKFGSLDPRDWVGEGDGLIASAAILRTSWQRRRRSFSRDTEKRTANADLWRSLVGAPRASMLLVAYAVEMYAKAGLLKAYAGCDDGTFLADARSRRFGHDLGALCAEIRLPVSADDAARLARLETLISDARYPIDAADQNTYVAEKNQQTSLAWDQREFRACVDLARQVKRHAANIDTDKSNPATMKRTSLGANGYLAFRAGGGLPTRITFRAADKSFDLAAVGSLVITDPRLFEVRDRWNEAAIFEDTGRGTRLARPPVT